MRFERAELAAERDVLRGSYIRIAEQQDAVRAQRLRHVLHAVGAERAREVDACNFRAAGRGQLAYG